MYKISWGTVSDPNKRRFILAPDVHARGSLNPIDKSRGMPLTSSQKPLFFHGFSAPIFAEMGSNEL